MTFRCFLAAGFTMFTLLTVGCEPATTSDPAATAESEGGAHLHDEIKDYADGVAQLKELHASIAAEFESGGDAHKSLHAVGHLLTHFPDKIEESTVLDDDGKTTAKSAVESMMESYTKIDEAIHEGKDADYSSVSQELSDAMATLEGLVSSE